MSVQLHQVFHLFREMHCRIHPGCFDINWRLKYLSKNQYGFRKNHSTSLALLDLYDKISLAIDRKEFAVGVFFGLV